MAEQVNKLCPISIIYKFMRFFTQLIKICEQKEICGRIKAKIYENESKKVFEIIKYANRLLLSKRLFTFMIAGN
jgi:hypothetical protein